MRLFMTKQRDYRTSLHDILTSANNCIEFTCDMSFDEFETDLKTHSAVLHQIMIIGEAVKRLSAEFTEKYPNVPWKEMAKMRDVLIHHYEEIDLKIPWSVIKKELPKVIFSIEEIMKKHG
jgi:uncharacterized protein with HEPN domain